MEDGSKRVIERRVDLMAARMMAFSRPFRN
jgi:hypothetical protein